MNKCAFIIVFAVLVIIVCTTCKNEDNTEKSSLESPYIEGLTIDNFPKIDNSTSTYPLSLIIACKLFDIDYKWKQYSNTETWYVEPQMSGSLKKKFDQLIMSSQTHGSFINLITKDIDLILSARTMSSDEMIYANEAGISLTETPVALDAFIFIVNPYNSIESLTVKQIQDIYMGEITSWNEVGGTSAPINPYVRNSNSGSQELMDSLVMKDLEYFTYFPISDEVVIFSMSGAFERVNTDINSICYTVYYFKEYQIRRDGFTKTIAVNGIYPDSETIGSHSYPLVAEVFAVIRSDTDQSSMAYKVYEWLLTEAGKQTISESGYIPY